VYERLARGVVEMFEVRNPKRADGLDRHAERLVRATVLSNGLPPGPQQPQHPRSIKPLSFTMLAETHRVDRLG
jgi:hypothetical protein